MLLCNWFCCAESQTNLLSAKQTQNLFCCLANPSPYFEEVDVAVQGQTKFDPFTLCHDCLQWKLPCFAYCVCVFSKKKTQTRNDQLTRGAIFNCSWGFLCYYDRRWWASGDASIFRCEHRSITKFIQHTKYEKYKYAMHHDALASDFALLVFGFWPMWFDSVKLVV